MATVYSLTLGAVLRTDPPVRRTLVAYAHKTPDPLTSAFVALLAEWAYLS